LRVSAGTETKLQVSHKIGYREQTSKDREPQNSKKKNERVQQQELVLAG
jgi:hypothetical protein